MLERKSQEQTDRYNSATVRNLVLNLKNLASRAEDVLENYAIEVTSKKRSGSKNLKQKLKRYVCILGEWLSVHQTGKEIESIRSQMADLTKKLESMPSNSADHAQQQQQQLLLRQTYAHEVEENFVGMEKAMEHLIALIRDDKRRSNRVISVCGMGRLGKTTLARKIYHHKEVCSRFESRAWVTRNENVASEEHVYKLDYVTDDQGLELLQKIALPNFHSQVLKSEATQLEATGRKIVKKCGHLPLAISVIGGSLRGKQSLSDWEKVSNNIDTYLKHGEGVSDKDKRVKQVLDLSYNVLPYYLKSCFLYLGYFKEDEKINIETLYLLWMAEGLISSEDKGSSETLIDVAERYLSELALMCMVQVQYEKDDQFLSFSSTYNKFKSCQLHDLMRDLCLSKAEE